MGAAFDDGSGGVREVDAVGRLADEHGAGGVVLGADAEEQSQEYDATKHDTSEDTGADDLEK